MTVLMAAPNGARKTKADHPALPVTLEEIVACAVDCAAAGADAIHLHVRDGAGGPSLDPGLYREAIEGVAAALGDRLAVQASTETHGGFAPEDIAHLLKTLRPAAASVALRDLAPTPEDLPRARALFDWARGEGVGLQHILYAPEGLERLREAIPADAPLSLLFVLGRYDAGLESNPAELAGFVQALQASGLAERSVWSVCAFGKAESRSLAAAAAMGGHCRVGFENSLHMADGSPARDNAQRVGEIRGLIASLGLGDNAEGHALNRVLGRV